VFDVEPNIIDVGGVTIGEVDWFDVVVMGTKNLRASTLRPFKALSELL